MKPEYFQRCQVETPSDVVTLLWSLAKKARPRRTFDAVLDLGAGDARFARDSTATFSRYVGIERDVEKIRRDNLPSNAEVICGDAMKWQANNFDLAIGNPPYIRHHHLDPSWRAEIISSIHEESDILLKRTANLYVLFLMKALQRTCEDGLVVQLVPFEWVTRPSAAELREHIVSKRWNVRVYRFNADIFPSVLTTASIVLIDKSQKDGRWEFGEIGRNGTIREVQSPSGNSSSVLPYASRHSEVHALRGLSPGGQDIFVLTEEERLYYSLRKNRDVAPCVTSLRRLDAEATVLDAETFAKTFIEAGARCWLIRSDRQKRSPELNSYLKSVGTRWKQYTTCTNRSDWACYMPHPTPVLLISSGFVGKGPKILVNEIGAVAVGSVYGVLTSLSKTKLKRLVDRLRTYDFGKRLVHHANNLKKIEVRQLNAVLDRLLT